MPRLTDQQKQEIIQRLNDDMPLPERYRFLLFNNSPQAGCLFKCLAEDMCREVRGLRIIEQIGRPYPAESVTDSGNEKNVNGFWRNKLVCGDNRLILSSLINGPARKVIEDQNGIKLIYIDPPFCTGADFSMPVEIGGNSAGTGQAFERAAYGDKWESGEFVRMLAGRLALMHALLAEDGSIYVHCDWRTAPYVRLLLDQVFKHHVNEIIWHYTGGGRSDRHFSRKHDTIFIYAKTDKFIFNKDEIRIAYKKTSGYAKSGIVARSGRRYLPNPLGTVPDDVWDLPIINPLASERLGYPTQKPEALLERIILASSRKGDLVADFFCGSGTLPAVAQRLGRKWLAADIGALAIHTARKRLIEVIRSQKQPDQAGFEVLVLANNARTGMQDFQERVLDARGGRMVSGYENLQGEKNGRMLAIAPANAVVDRVFIERLGQECERRGITGVELLGSEFATGLLPDLILRFRNRGLNIMPVRVMDQEDGQIDFGHIGCISAGIRHDKNTIAVELTGFRVFCDPEALVVAEKTLRKGQSKITAANGQIVKIIKDRDGSIFHKILTHCWTDWLDYWAVDFDYEGCININDGRNPQVIFKNSWADFRTRKKRSLNLVSGFREIGRARRAAVLAVDVFGQKAMTVLELQPDGAAGAGKP